MPKVVFADKQVIVGGIIHPANKPINVTDELAKVLVEQGATIVEEPKETKVASKPKADSKKVEPKKGK